MRYTHVFFALLVAANSVSHGSDNNNAGSGLLSRVGILASVACFSGALVLKKHICAKRILSLENSNRQIKNAYDRRREDHDRAVLEQYASLGSRQNAVLQATGLPKVIADLVPLCDAQQGKELYRQFVENELLFNMPSTRSALIAMESKLVPCLLDSNDIECIGEQKKVTKAFVVSLYRRCAEQRAAIRKLKGENIDLSTAVLQELVRDVT